VPSKSGTNDGSPAEKCKQLKYNVCDTEKDTGLMPGDSVTLPNLQLSLPDAHTSIALVEVRVSSVAAFFKEILADFLVD